MQVQHGSEEHTEEKRRDNCREYAMRTFVPLYGRRYYDGCWFLCRVRCNKEELSES